MTTMHHQRLGYTAVLALSVGLVLVLSIVVIASVEVTGAPPASLILAIALIVILAASNLKCLAGSKWRNAYVVLFLAKFALLVYQSAYKNLPMGGVDWGSYHNGADALLAQSGSVGSFVLSPDFDLFTKLVAVIYSVFGSNAEQIYFWIFATSLITFNFVYHIAVQITNDRARSQIAALLFMVWPIEFIFSITFLREMPIQCLFAVSLYSFVRFIKTRRLVNIIAAVIFAGFASMMHGGMIAVVLTYLFIAFQTLGRRGLDLNPVKTAVFAVVVLAIMSSPVGQSMTLKFSGIEGVDDVIEAKQGAMGDTKYISTAPSNPISLLTQTPYRMVMFALAPFPWQVYSLDTVIAWLIDGIFRIWLVYRIIMYIRQRKGLSPEGRVLQVSCVLILLLTYMIFAWGTNNYGTAMRHRTKMFPLEIVLAYPCYEVAKQRQRKRRMQVYAHKQLN